MHACVHVRACMHTCWRSFSHRYSPYVHVCKFALPDYCGHALTNTHMHTLFLSSEAPPASESPRTHTHTRTVKVRGFAKLQQTGFLLRSHSSFSLSLSLLPLKLVKAGCLTGSRAAGSDCWQPCISLFFISLHACLCV